MIIKYHKRFEKRYKKLSPSLQRKAQQAIEIFQRNPYDIRINNHALAGKMRGQRAFSVTGDVRIIFEESDNYLFVLFLAIGSHPQVYR